MRKVFTLSLFACLFTLNTQAQVIVLWGELYKDWTINSNGYPREEPSLDSLYYKLSSFSLSLREDKTYEMAFSKDSIVTGTFSIDKKKKIIALTDNTNKATIEYTVAELTPHVLLLIIPEKYHWAFYLSLTPHLE